MTRWYAAVASVCLSLLGTPNTGWSIEGIPAESTAVRERLEPSALQSGICRQAPSTLLRMWPVSGWDTSPFSAERGHFNRESDPCAQA